NALKQILGVGLFAALTACSLSEDANGTDGAKIRGGGKAYFDLETYFLEEIQRLQKDNPTIKKTVWIDGVPETKSLKISKWANELDLFLNSDINKPAWRNSYQVDSTQNQLIYKANEKGLRTRWIQIRKNAQGDLVQISIRNETDNMIYRTEEILNYFSDSLYSIEKNQRVRILGKHQYRFQGEF